MEPKLQPIWIALGALSIGFHIWLIFSGLVPSLVARPIHMALALPWVFLFNVNDKKRKFFGATVACVGFLLCGYIALNEAALSDQYGFVTGWAQIFVAFGLLLIVLFH